MICLKDNQKHLPKKHNVYTRDIKNVDREHFLLELLAINWEMDESDANKSFDMFFYQ